MSELISGKEALIALANGEAVECSNISIGEWHELDDNSPLSLLLTGKNRNGFDFQFRLKPRTITINGIEVPAPFKPNKNDDCRIYAIDTRNACGWHWQHSSHYKSGYIVWSTEEEIKQVVAALRSIFK